MDEKGLVEIKDLIHGLDKNITTQIGDLDKKLSVFQERLKNIDEKLTSFESQLTNKADIKEFNELKLKFEKLESDFYKIKEEASKNTEQRKDLSKFNWIIIGSIVSLVFYIFKTKFGV